MGYTVKARGQPIPTSGLSLYRAPGCPIPAPSCKKPNAMAGLSARPATKILWLLDLGSNQGPAD